MKTKALFIASVVVMLGLLITDAVQALQQDPSAYSGVSITSSSASPTPKSVSSFVPTPSSSTGTTTTAVTTSNVTENWAGYVSTSGNYTAISGSWTVPTVDASDGATTADAAWIGIGGETSQDLIQVGTLNAVQNGQVTPSAFYERLPDTSDTISTINVNPGDNVSASIREVSTGEWVVAITDMTNGESFSNTVAYTSTHSSAEWIEEAPSDETGIMPLDAFGSITFTGGSTVDNGATLSIAASKAQAITMAGTGGQALTTTSSLDSAGDGFTVTRTGVSSASSSEQYVTVPNGWSRSEPGLSIYYGLGQVSGTSTGGQSYIPTFYHSW